ncbi:hypothetical protein LEMLEM_LOCUS3729 [Lemmus lemmus]
MVLQEESLWAGAGSGGQSGSLDLRVPRHL